MLLLEHPSVYTAGKRTEPADRPFDGTPVVDVDRGGKITWHGPGQLVGYPIVRLPDPIDVVAYVRRMEQLLIDVCAELGLPRSGSRGAAASGSPADERGPDRKVAAIGIRVARGVTLHGFAINCDCDLSRFDRIVPCGIRDAGVTSLSAELGRDVTVERSCRWSSGTSRRCTECTGLRPTTGISSGSTSSRRLVAAQREPDHGPAATALAELVRVGRRRRSKGSRSPMSSRTPGRRRRSAPGPASPSRHEAVADRSASLCAACRHDAAGARSPRARAGSSWDGRCGVSAQLHTRSSR